MTKEKSEKIIEYGQEIDLRKKIYPDDVTSLILDPGHPGENDEAYVARRSELFDICRHNRLNGLGPPHINYTAEETRVWREVTSRLQPLHIQHACSLYLRGKEQLKISEREIPQLSEISKTLDSGPTHMHLVPAEGALDYVYFYQYIENRGFPVTQFIRHGSNPEFTPEPDIVHDCLGHVPPLVNASYADFLTMIGKAAMIAKRSEKPDVVFALKRFSWFSTEFGLIDEGGETKIFGAGILSSCGEIPFSLSSDVLRRPFETKVVVETDYNPSQMQDKLFIIPSYEFLWKETKEIIRYLGIDVGKL